MGVPMRCFSTVSAATSESDFSLGHSSPVAFFSSVSSNPPASAGKAESSIVSDLSTFFSVQWRALPIFRKFVERYACHRPVFPAERRQALAVVRKRGTLMGQSAAHSDDQRSRKDETGKD